MALIPPAPTILRETVRRALSEDIDRGDITTEACIDPATQGVAVVQARDALVLSGLVVIEEVYRQVDASVRVTRIAQDGDSIAEGALCARVEGPAAALLIGERVGLNFAQRMSGIATFTRRCVDAIPKGSKTRITDTRKTTPGLRAFERYAVRCGGGHNHREDLSAAVLIKDNHIAAAGSITNAINRAKDRAPHTSRIECEVETEAEVQEALDAGADIIMLDNFNDARVEAALKTIGGKAIVEASGGITLKRIATLGALGVDVISMGALTHSSPSSNLALDWET